VGHVSTDIVGKLSIRPCGACPTGLEREKHALVRLGKVSNNPMLIRLTDIVSKPTLGKLTNRQNDIRRTIIGHTVIRQIDVFPHN